jgi:histone deacetylase 11
MYKRIRDELIQKRVMNETQFIQPKKATRDQLLRIHSERYLQSLGNSENIAKIVEFWPLQYFPSLVLERKFLIPMQYAVGGTILAGLEIYMIDEKHR